MSGKKNPAAAESRAGLSFWETSLLLLPDTETRENPSQQIVRGKLAGDLA